MRSVQVLVLQAAGMIAACAIGCTSNSGEAGAPTAAKTGPALSGVTSDLTEVAYGAEKKLSFQPDQRGTLYVYDEGVDQFIYTGQLRRNQKFEIDPANSRVTVNGQPLSIPIDPKHVYRIYFSAAK